MKVNYLFNTGDTAAIINNGKLLLHDAPNSAVPNALMGNIFAQLNMPDSAFAYYDRALIIEPDYGYANLQKAYLYNSLGDSTNYEKEISATLLNKNIDVDTKVDILTDYIRDCIQQGDSSARVDNMFRTILNQHPHEAQIRHLFSDYLSFKKDYKNAAEQLSYVLDIDPSDPKNWERLIWLEIFNNNYDKAIESGKKAVEYAPDELSLYQALGFAYFKKEDYSSAIATYDTLLVRNKDIQMVDEADIHTSLGDIYQQIGDTANAIKNYVLANEKSTRNGIDKAINQIALGGLYFDRYEYDKAQPCYSEGVAQLPEDYQNYAMLKKRSDVLDELAVYSQNVTLQDSLLALSKLSPEEQKKVADRLVKELKDKEKKAAEEAALQALASRPDAAGSQLKSNTQNYTLNTDKSWYFYNTATKNAGKTEFQRRWGSRKLEDDWRRANKTTFSVGDFNSEADYGDDDKQKEMVDSLGNPLSDEEIAARKKNEEQLAHEQDPHFPEYYLVQIPKTEEEIQNSHNIVQEGLFNMGIILKDKLEDVNAAEAAFNELLTRYPDNVYRLDIYYNMYLMYVRYGYADKAETCRQKILADFADTKYGMALADPNYIENLRNMESEQERMYEKTYADYLANRNAAVHEGYQGIMNRYPLSKIMPKFMLLDALSYLSEKKYDRFQETLKELLVRYPDTDITPLASSILKDLAKGRKPNSGAGGNVRGMIWSIRLTNDTAAVNSTTEYTPFDTSREGPHICLLTYPVDSVSSNRLLFDVARHNFSNYAVRDFDIDRQTYGQLGIIIIKGFTSYADLEDYSRQLFADRQVVIPRQVRPVFISEKNFDLLLKEGRSFSDYFLFLQEQSDDAVEAPLME